MTCDGNPVYVTGSASDRTTRWHLPDGRATKTISDESSDDRMSLSPTGDGPSVSVRGHWNRHYTYPVPGDRSSRVLTELGAVYVATAPGRRRRLSRRRPDPIHARQRLRGDRRHARPARPLLRLRGRRAGGLRSTQIDDSAASARRQRAAHERPVRHPRRPIATGEHINRAHAHARAPQDQDGRDRARHGRRGRGRPRRSRSAPLTIGGLMPSRRRSA